MTRRTFRIAAVAGSLVALLSPAAPAQSAPGVAPVAPQQRVEQGGITIGLRFHEPLAGVAAAEVALTDSASGRAIEGARPAAWLVARRSEPVASERSCEDKAAALMSGSLGARADVDLNGYRLVTLNQDDTLAFINPHVGLKGSKLESIVQLPGRGHDWVVAPRSQRLFVSLRELGAVAVVDVGTRRLLAVIPTGENSLPTRLALDEAGNRVWVGLDGAAQVLALDAGSGREVARVAVGRGLHTLSVEPGVPWLAVANSQSDDVTLIDRGNLTKIADVAVGATPVAVAWSASAERFVVLSINAGEASLVDPTTGKVAAAISLERGAVQLGLFDGGRRALVLNGRTDTLSVLDLATPRVTARMAVPGGPDQLAFSRDYAYVRSLATPNVQVVNLAQAREGRLQAVSVPMGRSRPADTPAALNVALVFAPAPEGNGVLVASAGDGSVYRYAEGMMVPVGSFSNYRRQARALRVLDTSLAEREPGRFEAAAAVEHGGRYDVVVRNLRPSVTACFIVEARGSPTQAEPAPPASRLLAVRELDARSVRVEFSLADGDGRPLNAADVRLLAMQLRGGGQQRVAATSLGAGRYRVDLAGLAPAEFELMVQAPSAELGFERGRLGRLRWPLERAP